jgi:2'-5' RNA ligase
MQDCRAYVVQADLDEECRRRLAEAQDRLAGVLPGSVVCPPASLHVSVAVLLSVRRDYPAPKDALWAQWGSRWCDQLRALAEGFEPFELRFERLEVSESAVIALAGPVAAVESLRRRAAALQRDAGLVAYQPSIVHCTLLRYGTTGLQLDELGRVASATPVRARTVVTHLTVRRELVYPSVVSEAVDRFDLRGRLPDEGRRPPLRAAAR